MRGRPARRAHGLHPRELGIDPRLGRTVAVEAWRHLDDAATVAREHVGEREELVGQGPRPGDVAAVGHAVPQRARRRPAERAARQRLVEEARHRLELLGRRRRRLVEAPLAHGVVAERGVTDHAADVDAEGRAVEPREVVAVRLPVPREPVEDAPCGDVLDRLHHLRDVGVVVGSLHRGERHATVADHDGRDAVPARRRPDRVPRELGVEVRVHVDESRRDEATIGVELAGAALGHRADRDDPIAVDGHVRGSRRRARAVDERAVPDHEVVHGGQRYRRCRSVGSDEPSDRTCGASPDPTRERSWTRSP